MKMTNPLSRLLPFAVPLALCMGCECSFVLQGTITDCANGQPIAGAEVTYFDFVEITGSDGFYEFSGTTLGCGVIGELGVSAPGYDTIFVPSVAEGTTNADFCLFRD